MKIYLGFLVRYVKICTNKSFLLYGTLFAIQRLAHCWPCLNLAKLKVLSVLNSYSGVAGAVGEGVPCKDRLCKQ